ncbi:MAG: hypothetical protein AB7N91_30070 [Candidatus Tectimicrobiota bacterium]
MEDVYGEPRWRPLRRTLGLLLLFGSAVLTGCLVQAPYQPDSQRVAALGVSQAQQQLEGVLLRSINPPITAVEVTGDFVRVDVGTTTYQVRVFFQDVQKADVYTNHLVILRGADDRLLFRPIFANAQDATTFADLMLAMRTR